MAEFSMDKMARSIAKRAMEVLKDSGVFDADTISRKHLLSEIDDLMKSPWFNNGKDDAAIPHYGYVERKEAVEIVRDLCVKAEPSIIPKQNWIPVSERLPEELEPVNITWINHNPESYYADIKDKPFTATGVYFNGQWYWWSTICTDILAEYSHNYDDIIDDDIEVTAWMPLPEPYKEGESE